jgi:hypothetical protein
MDNHLSIRYSLETSLKIFNLLNLSHSKTFLLEMKQTEELPANILIKKKLAFKPATYMHIQLTLLFTHC